jgi:MATE family multidrug resistance protein
MHYRMKRKEKFSLFEGFSPNKIQKAVNIQIIKLGFPSAMQMFF